MPVTDAGAKKAARGKRAKERKALQELHERIRKAEWAVESDVQFLFENPGRDGLADAVAGTGIYVWFGNGDCPGSEGGPEVPNVSSYEAPSADGRVLVGGKPMFVLIVSAPYCDDDGNAHFATCRVAVPDLDRSPGELTKAVWPFWVKSKEESLMNEAAVLLKHGVSPGRLHELVDLVTVKEVLSS